MIKFGFCMAFAGLIATMPATSSAKEVVVQMKNNGSGGIMIFQPAFVRAEPGDIIHFVATDKGHNAESIPGMVPAGVTPFSSPISRDFRLKVTRPGVYGVRCTPHFGLGMVALVQVGNGPSANLQSARSLKLPPLAAKRMGPLLAQAR